MQLPVIAIDGVIGAQVSPLDRGLAYGDGLFETCRLHKGSILLWEYHSERLAAGCQRLGISLSLDVVDGYLASVIASANVSEAVVKITVTRGQGGRGYKWPDAAQPSVIIAVHPAAEYPSANAADGVRVHLCNLRLGINPALAGIKHLNRLEQVLARAEWSDETIAEGILFDAQGNLIEAVFSNIFLVKDGVLLTPDLSSSGVAGVMRRHILEHLAPSCSVLVEIMQLGMSDLLQADEIFLCNSIYGIWPVREILTSDWNAASPGPITQRLQDALTQSLIHPFNA